MVVDFTFPRPNVLNADKDIKFMLTPRSQNALSKEPPIVQKIMKLPGSFNFWRSFFCRIALLSSINFTVSLSSSFCFIDIFQEFSIIRHLYQRICKMDVYIDLFKNLQKFCELFIKLLCQESLRIWLWWLQDWWIIWEWNSIRLRIILCFPCLDFLFCKLLFCLLFGIRSRHCSLCVTGKFPSGLRVYCSS